MTLHPYEFIRRFLTHVLPKGFVPLTRSRATQGLKYLRKLTESLHRSELTLRAI